MDSENSKAPRACFKCKNETLKLPKGLCLNCYAKWLRRGRPVDSLNQPVIEELPRRAPKREAKRALTLEQQAQRKLERSKGKPSYEGGIVLTLEEAKRMQRGFNPFGQSEPDNQGQESSFAK